MTTIFAAISGSALLNVLIWIIVLGVIFWLLNWLIDYCKLPDIINKVAKVILAIAIVVFLINALLGLTGGRQFISF